MMKNHDEKLRQDYEDAFFALAINELAKEEGAELAKENERLKNDPNFVIPESITLRSLETIRKAVVKKKRKKTLHTVRKVLVTAACVSAIASLMAVTAYAVIPEFRIVAQNLLIEATDLATRLELTDGNTKKEPEEIDSNQKEAKILFGYQIPELPEEFVLEDEWYDDKAAWVRFVNKAGAKVKINFRNVAFSMEVDTEEANATKISVQGYEGIISEKGDTVSLVWHDTNTNVFIKIEGKALNANFIETLANQMIPRK